MILLEVTLWACPTHPQGVVCREPSAIIFATVSLEGAVSALVYYMNLQSQRAGKQVRLTIFENEPVARMAEQRLQLEGIPSMIRPLQGGPGLWGSAYNLPHGLYVFQSDAIWAKDVLELPPSEIVERAEGDASSGASRFSNIGLIVIGTGIALFLILAMPALSGLFR